MEYQIGNLVSHHGHLSIKIVSWFLFLFLVSLCHSLTVYFSYTFFLWLYLVKADYAKARELDQKIREEKKKDSRIVKLLLLGAGESGKSTLWKQTIALYGTGFDEETRESYKVKPCLSCFSSYIYILYLRIYFFINFVRRKGNCLWLVYE